MKATLIRTSSMPSKKGGTLWYAFFKGEDGKSYRSCIWDRCRNFSNWKSFLDSKDISLDNLLKLKEGFIDADSKPIKIES